VTTGGRRLRSGTPGTGTWPAWVTAALQFVLPSACLSCRRYLSRPDLGICPECRVRLTPIPHPRCPRCRGPLGPEQVWETRTTSAHATARCRECLDWPDLLEGVEQVAVLEGPARELIHALKYDGWTGVAPVLADLLAPLLPTHGGWATAPLVPIPTSPRRIRQRGYNQAEVLARALAERSGRSCWNVLGRRGGEGTQVALHLEERRANVQDAFYLLSEALGRVSARPVVLVDDVLTTGATARAGVQALQEAGATGVWVAVFARTLPDRRLDPEDIRR
jgi:ComF family protein